ncbi:MAG: T9SS type A sorting domain-containing protein, partial [Phaeodactylibacter sp.]|nr:T9SS type A sorting domain-containing protein [Phaeodactylibacter sp.]
GLFIFDFNRLTGLLSEFRYIDIDDGAFIGGVAVSPSSRYLYVCSEKFLYQFDLYDENIASSQITIGEYDGYLSPFPTNFYNAQLAPDCKIYINSFASVDVLHVIHNPDEPGLGCNFEQHAIQLPFNHRRSLPHFPNYRLGPLVEGEDPPPPCEPVVSTKEALLTRPKAYVFPNPAPGYFKVVFEQAPRRPGRAVLYNGLGQVVLEEALETGSREFRIELSGVAAGLYFYGVFRDGVAVKGGKLVVAGGR